MPTTTGNTSPNLNWKSKG